MQITPPLEEVLRHRGDDTHLALTVELAGDTETPTSLYFKLSGDQGAAFLLESVEGGEVLGRYSFIGFEAGSFISYSGRRGLRISSQTEEVLPEHLDPLAAVAEALKGYRIRPRSDLPRFQGGAVGYLGFDQVVRFEPVPLALGPGPGVPDTQLMLVEDLAIFDHLRQRIIVLTHVPLEGDRRGHYRRAELRLMSLVDRLRSPPPPARTLISAASLVLPAFRANLDRAGFMSRVEEAKESIQRGEIFQVVLSRRLTVDKVIDPFSLYRALRSLNPSPYMFYLRFPGFSVVGASPEVLVRLEGDEILLRPIAGTRPRGNSRQEDADLAQELLADEKELAEHRMLLDLGRNDVGRVSELGSVGVERPLHLEYYSHVMHLVSDVRGRRRPGVDAFGVLRACFPAGTVSGAPKVRALEIIAALEPDRRGLYAGAVGYFDFTGNMDTCIAIRTLLVERDQVHLSAGAGIVHDSDPGREFDETLNKAKSGLLAIALADSGGLGQDRS